MQLIKREEKYTEGREREEKEFFLTLIKVINDLHKAHRIIIIVLMKVSVKLKRIP